MSENESLTASAREQIDSCLLIPPDLQEALRQIAADPLVAHIIRDFLTPRNEIVAEHILPDINDGLSGVNEAIDRKTRQVEQLTATDELMQELKY